MNDPSTPAASGRKKRGSRLLIGLLLVLGGVSGGVVIVWVFGHVEGEQFSPTTFYSRTFYYKQVPMLGMQVSKTTYYDNSGPLQVMLSTKYGMPVGSGATVWHTVSSVGMDGVKRTGGAALLYRYLSDEAGDFWLDWNNKHPDLADPLWKAVARVARRGRYEMIPDLMRLARDAQEPQAFEAELNRMLAERWLTLGRVLTARGLSAEAVAAFDESLHYHPDGADALAARAEAQKGLGTPKKPAGE